MNVGMFFKMSMLVYMLLPAQMIMRMAVGSFPVKVSQADNHIDKTESYEEPSCNVSPE